MNEKPLRDCTACLHIQRPVYIVGAHTFSVDLLADFIASNTPATWETFKSLQDIPPHTDPHEADWRLIFLDCHGLDGTDLPEKLRAEASHILQHDILALFNLQRDNSQQMELFALGVRGFFYEDDPKEAILRGICALKNGDIWISRGILLDYINRFTTPPVEQPANTLLTRREKQILVLVAAGTSNEEIAARLYISPHTVKTHIYNIFKKIGAKTRLQAALWAAKNIN